MQPVGRDKPNVAEKTGTDIPTAVVPVVYGFYGNQIRSAGGIQIASDIYLIRSVTIGIEVSLCTVNPYFGLRGGGFYI